LCAEALWWRCHRALISDELKASGIKATHILWIAQSQEHPYTSAAQIRDGKLTYMPAQNVELALGWGRRFSRARFWLAPAQSSVTI
jgi:uncharacterized protein (DUF488 family)